ncbi:phosphoglycerate mutase family protein [Streptococcus sp. H31]|uniref:phosphoglycerate mutase family protein n=1 Tax=Streptococcus huangxiaojuni TaxID=3237239 RepID=UPI0034A5C0A2
MFDSIYSSNQRRAIETNDIISTILEQKNTNFKIDKRLREWDFGSFDGQNMKDAFKKLSFKNKFNYIFGKLTLEQVANYIYQNDSSNSVEDWKKLQKRIWSAFISIIRETTITKDQNVLIISHGLTILTLIYLINEEKKYFQTLPNGFMTIIDYDGTIFKIK